MRQTLIFFCLLVSGHAANAQRVGTGSLTGAVSDQAGAKLSYVIVSLMNTATGAQSFTHSTPHGGFGFASLPIGNYTMNVSAAGFSKAQIEGIVIQRNQNLAVHLILSPVESVVVKVAVNSPDATIKRFLSPIAAKR